MKILNNASRFVLILLLSGFSFQLSAKSGDDAGESFDAGSLILHHIMDDYGWHIATTTDANGEEHHITIPLPIILYTDNGLVTFMSSEFHHAENGIVEKDGMKFKLDHGHISTVTGSGEGHVMDFSITKNVASMLISVLVMFMVFIPVASSYKKRKGQAPKGLQSFIEPIIVYIRDDIAIPNIGADKYKKYFPYLVILFFFVWINNLLGLVPSGANASGNIAFTMTLSVFTLLLTVFSGNSHYWMHILWTPGVPLFVRPIMIIVEILGIFTKPFALMIRLFANITAGHIIILSLVSMIFIFKTWLVGIPVVPVVIAMNCLELFVALLQAYVFTLLTALFIGLAVEEGEHH